MENKLKWYFGIVGLLVLGALQLGAWNYGIDGQTFAFTSSTIVAIIAFLLGLNIPSPSQKIAVREAVTAVINNKPKT